MVNSIQERINSTAFNILNRNKIEKRVVFVYEDEDKKNFLTSDKTLTKREVIVYRDIYKAVIYEYIYTKYPYFLKNNIYIDNKYYQNFLLTSINNRKMLEEKVRTNSGEKLKYE